MPPNSYATLFKDGASPAASLRGRMRAAVRSMSLSALATLSPGKPGPFLRCLYCHYVFDDQREQFERIIAGLKQTGTFVSTEKCLDMLEGKHPIDGRYFHLSFDDGFKNNYTNAFPILKKLEVPAIFFVPTAYIGADWEQAREYCFGTSTAYNGVIEMMTWDDLREMAAAGFEIGSHTRKHAKLSAVSHDPQRLLQEIQGSKDDIEKNLNQPCPYISWPYGRLTDVDEATVTAVRNAGYTAFFAAVRGTIVPGKTSGFCIPRHHFEPQWPQSHIRYFANGNHETL